MAALVLLLLPLGLVIGNNWGGALQDALYDLHRSIGIVVLVLIAVRLGYRLTHPPLRLPDDIPPLLRHEARTARCGNVHRVLPTDCPKLTPISSAVEAWNPPPAEPLFARMCGFTIARIGTRSCAAVIS
jgi:hypothetical protein